MFNKFQTGSILEADSVSPYPGTETEESHTKNMNNNQYFVIPAVIIGACLLLGLVAGGYFIGKGSERFRMDSRTVTVKGLVEQEVKADLAIWTLAFRRAGNDLKAIHDQICTDRETTIAFLKKQGFKDNEISQQAVRTIDKLAREYGGQEVEPFRYLVSSSLILKTSDVDLVVNAIGTTEELLQSGVILYGNETGKANPLYVVTSFNDIRPQLLALSTQNARLTARQFAEDSGTQVGRIQSANQGVIQIFGSDGNDESAPYSPTSTPEKKIRVVSTFVFELK